MNNFKFKVWCHNKKEWEKDSCLLTEHGALLHLMPNGSYGVLKPDSHTACFFVDNQSKNGKDIYEGDIVITHAGDTGVIRWKEDLSHFEIKYINTIGWDYPREVIKIIGNIYENPELLEKGGKNK